VTGFIDSLTPEGRREIRDLRMRCVGPPDQRTPHPLTFAPNEDARYLTRVWNDGLLVSYLWLIERTILVQGQPARIVGIRSVATDPAHRRRGFGTAAMRHTADFIWRELKPDFGMLLSSVMGVPFYLSLGWQIVEGPVWIDQPSGRLDRAVIAPDRPTMVLLPEGAALPQGPIDLCGLPF
jgi:GNAT superfamily N-acetyltransferase